MARLLLGGLDYFTGQGGEAVVAEIDAQTINPDNCCENLRAARAALEEAGS
jgi:hypothetical protein